MEHNNNKTQKIQSVKEVLNHASIATTRHYCASSSTISKTKNETASELNKSTSETISSCCDK